MTNNNKMQFNVTGMSCAACQARVEKAVSSLTDVANCSVNLLTNSMVVEGFITESEVIKAVENAGYGATVVGAKSAATSDAGADELKDTETPAIAKRLVASLIFLLPLLYVSMGNMLFGWQLPGFLAGNHLSVGLYELILTGIIMVINQKFFISGFKGLYHRSPNMDTLVALGSAASFGYSVYALFAMSSAMMAGNHAGAMAYMDEFYFESAAMILTLITVGKMLEARSKGKTVDAIRALMKLAPKTAVLRIDGALVETPIEQVKVGDVFVVKAGENIPVDGAVIEGSGAVNESALTGESIPVDKTKGDEVSAATTNLTGYMVCQATRVGSDTTLSQIIQMVSDASASKAPIAKIADRVSGVFVPVVMGIAAVTFIVWSFLGAEFGFALARAISVLVISCPCALGLATPVAIMVGSGVGAKNGIMFKNATSLEETGKMSVVALDKTGTITKGEPKVTKLIPALGVEESRLLKAAYALEAKSEHPLARAVVEEAVERGFALEEVSDFEILAGLGLKGKLDGEDIFGGNYDYIKTTVEREDFDLKNRAEAMSDKGQTPLYFSAAGNFLGVICVADVLKEDSLQAVSDLKKLGFYVVMLTGDNEKTAKTIGDSVGVDEVVAGVRPDGKEAVIRKLQSRGKVAMVGDGINDAPALTRADIGIAIGSGTDVAIDAADIVLMKNSLMDVVGAIRLSRKTLRNIHENLFWAFIYNVIGIPLAAGVFVKLGLTLNPMFGAAAMSLSSFCVVSNALRLNLVKIYDKVVSTETLKTQGIKKADKKEDTMKITVNGMMCQHCEAHVKESIEKISGVTEAVADHDNNCVTITTAGEVSEDAIKAAVAEAGYEYGGIIQ